MAVPVAALRPIAPLAGVVEAVFRRVSIASVVPVPIPVPVIPIASISVSVYEPLPSSPVRRWWRARERPAREHNRNVEHFTIELSFVKV